MATYIYGHPITRTARQCTRPGRDAEQSGGPPTLVCTHHTRLSRRGRTPYPWFALQWPHLSMAPQFRARTASSRGPVGMRNCWRDPRHSIAPTTPACRVGDARRTSGLDLHGHVLLWPPNAAHGPPVHAARLGCRIVGGTPEIGLHPPHPFVASGTRAGLVVWTSMATPFHGPPIPPTDRQITRPGRDAELLSVPARVVGTHHSRLSRRGRAPYPWIGAPWQHTSMATPRRGRTASARCPVGMRNCRVET